MLLTINPQFNKGAAYFLAVLICLLSEIAPAHAEYRVYQYQLQSLENPQVSYLQQSTLSPVSFNAYHGHQAVRAQLINTWTCQGSTAGQDYCPSPLVTLQKSQGAEQELVP